MASNRLVKAVERFIMIIAISQIIFEVILLRLLPYHTIRQFLPEYFVDFFWINCNAILKVAVNLMLIIGVTNKKRLSWIKIWLAVTGSTACLIVIVLLYQLSLQGWQYDEIAINICLIYFLVVHSALPWLLVFSYYSFLSEITDALRTLAFINFLAESCDQDPPTTKSNTQVMQVD